jgi:hypothetical protein
MLIAEMIDTVPRTLSSEGYIRFFQSLQGMWIHRETEIYSVTERSTTRLQSSTA